MRKVPTLFLRDPDDRARVLPEVNPDCAWVLAGEGRSTRKYDGTCMLYDAEGWWARREVKPGKTAPPNYRPIETDPVTGKTFGWEPVAQSAYAKYHAEALAGGVPVADWPDPYPRIGQTYELVGPRVNGNPEKVSTHLLVRHGYLATVDRRELDSLKLTFDGIGSWLSAHPGWEGIVWHHPDGRMAKIKRRDFPTDSP